jgi:hypothetical protein
MEICIHIPNIPINVDPSMHAGLWHEMSRHMSGQTTCTYTDTVHTQSIQSARLSLQSSELDPPPPHPLASVVLPPIGSGGTHSLAGEGAWGANSDEGADILVHC